MINRPTVHLIAATVFGLALAGCSFDSSGRRDISGAHHAAPAIAQENAADVSQVGKDPPAEHGHIRDNTAASALAATLPDWTPLDGQKLNDMPVLRSRGGVLDADLVTELRTIDLAGSPIATTPYNGTFTGPTLQVSPGDRLNVNLSNKSGEITNIHYHGLHVSPRRKGDNVFRMMKSGLTYRSTIDIPANHETGLFWYHAHMHGNTDPQIYGGMRGLLVVGDIVKKHLPNRFAGITEHLLSINDAFDQNGVVTNAAPLPKDDTLLVNGQLRPRWKLRPGVTQLLRFANTGADRFCARPDR